MLLRRVGLEQRASVDSAELSGGELRMLEVARQLFNQPSLLLLDEPTAGVAPHLQENLAELIRSVHEEGVAVIVVEHNLGFLLGLVDRVVCMAQGSVIADGTPTQIHDDPAVIAAYLGGPK
jgi:branched-chain amino acid transport system ATP-binding protein/branched-chain amino acid transport system permease protein